MNKGCITIPLFFIITLISCAKSTESKNFTDVFNKLSNAGSYNDIKKCYSVDTVKLIDSAEADGLISNDEKFFILPVFSPDIKWKEISKIQNEDKLEIRIRYIEHPVENMIGFEMDFKLVKENGRWKIDMAEDIKKAFEFRKKGIETDYLNDLRKQGRL